MVALNRGLATFVYFFFSLITEIALRSSEAGKTKNYRFMAMVYNKSICSLLGCILQWKYLKNAAYVHLLSTQVYQICSAGYANWNIIEKYKFQWEGTDSLDKSST